MNKLRVGIIGMGVMGVSHVRAYRAFPNDVEIVGAVEIDPQKRAEAEKNLSIECFSTFEALADRQLDAVSVCTPDDMHIDYVLKALQCGIRVLCEKPLEVSTDRCKRIIDAMPDDSYIMVGHTMRFDPRIIPIKIALDQNRIGRIVSVKINRSNTIAVGNRISPRSNIVQFLGIHDMDLMLWLLGKKVEKAHGYGKKVISDQVDYSMANILFEDGIIGTMENHWLLPNARPLKLDASLTIIGENGMLEADLNAHPVYCTDNQGNVQYFDSYLSAYDAEGLPRGDMYREIQHFIECVKTKSMPLVTARQAAEAVSAIELILNNMEIY